MSARILYVVNVGWFFVSHRLVLAQAALADGYEVHAATTITEPSERAAIVSSGIVLHDLHFDRSGFHPLAELRTLRSLRTLYRTVRPDLVHHVSIKPILYGGVVARATGVPAVVNAIPGLGYSFEGSSLAARLRRTLIMLGYRVALNHRNSRVIFQNREHLEAFCDKGTVPRSRTVLIRGSGVDVNQFVPKPEPAGPLTVVLASRMLREKGVFEFVEAARQLRAGLGNVRFWLVGDIDPGNPGSISVQQLRDWHSEGSVEWLGHRRDMANVLAQCHVACLPTYGEGLPKFLLEAAASGRPIVTTDIPGCRDIARQRVNALLVPPRDPIALAAALHELLTDAQLRVSFGAAGRALVEREFSQQHVLEQTLTLYRELLAVSS